MGEYEVSVEAYSGELMTRYGSMAVVVSRFSRTDALVPLRWLVPEEVRAQDGPPGVPGPPWVELTWRFSNSPHWLGYAIYRSDEGESDFHFISAVEPASPQITTTAKVFRDTVVEVDRTYRYRVAAVDSNGLHGPLSPEAVVSIPLVQMPPDEGGRVFVPTPTGPLDLGQVTSVPLAQTWLAVARDGWLYLLKPDGTESQQVGGGNALSWSPGARWLALQAVPAHLPAYLVDPDNGRTVLLGGRFRGWSPDGSKVLTASPFTAWVESVDAGWREKIADSYPVAWSPDGRWILLSMSPEFESLDAPPTLFLVPPEGGEPRFLTRGWAELGAFSPDGQRIAYLGGGDGTNVYRVIDVDGSNDMRLFGTGDGSHAHWSPDGQTILHNSYFDLRLMSWDGSAQRTIADNFGGCPSWSPAGDLIAFVANRREYDVYLHVIEADGSRERRLAQVVGDRPYSWSPQGRLLAASLREDTPTGIGIYLIDADTGNRTRVADGSAVLWSPLRQ